MRRKLAVLLTLCITAAAANYPAGINIARAGEVQEAEIARGSEGDFEYEELENGNLKLTRYEGSGTEAVIPSTINGKAVTMIGNEVFSGCTNLASITIPENVTNIGEGTGYTEYDVFDECSGLKEIIVDAGNVWYSSQDGVLYNEKKTQLILCPAGKEGSVAIPANVRDIGQPYAGNNAYYNIFLSCKNLTDILVDDGNAAYSSQDGILYNKAKTELICCPAGKTGSEKRCADCTS